MPERFADMPLGSVLAASVLESPLGLALLGAGVLVIGLALLAGYARLRRSKGSGSPCRIRSDRLSSVACEAEELAERLAERVERHACRLEGLITEADERLKRLDAMCRPPGARPRTGTFSEPKPQRAAPAGAGVDPLSQRVYGLADQGLPAIEIARKLEEQVGKVELILALRHS